MLSLDYVAGYVDGEGCITIQWIQDKRRIGCKFNGYEFRPLFQVHTYDHIIVAQLKGFFDSYKIERTRLYKNQSPNGKKYEPSSNCMNSSWSGVAKICTLLKDRCPIKQDVMKLFLQAYAIRKPPDRNLQGRMFTKMTDKDFANVKQIAEQIQQMNRGRFYKPKSCNWRPENIDNLFNK